MARDADRMRAVREARSNVWPSIDAKQGFMRAFLERVMPVPIKLDVKLVEQPLPTGQEALLDGVASPIPIATDENGQDLSQLHQLIGRFNMANSSYDKCGGLTQVLAMAKGLRTLGLDVMVGCMRGTSLVMTPAFLLG